MLRGRERERERGEGVGSQENLDNNDGMVVAKMRTVLDPQCPKAVGAALSDFQPGALLMQNQPQLSNDRHH